MKSNHVRCSGFPITLPRATFRRCYVCSVHACRLLQQSFNTAETRWASKTTCACFSSIPGIMCVEKADYLCCYKFSPSILSLSPELLRHTVNMGGGTNISAQNWLCCVFSLVICIWKVVFSFYFSFFPLIIKMLSPPAFSINAEILSLLPF